ncbi:hypothetical protein [Floccifex sp.]|uniref:hypothetical protein n=1 Tax=Floccifex sp. TaxID=2815810 RepID=UPI002A754B63|nr:hypothetical protein [Floccifex sp.]MDD7281824.1 hypothetical protein [Erysipelotrichaceae bacterium]MDY2958509.1 hypothetical protein [Floccifex sp.]
MKKIILTLMCLILISCTNGSCDFRNISWKRESDCDTETIEFRLDGSFSYFCGCGNPVNDSDLCDSYTYDEKTNTIYLNYEQTTEDSIPIIKIISCTDKKLKLDFNGEIRTFHR